MPEESRRIYQTVVGFIRLYRPLECLVHLQSRAKAASSGKIWRNIAWMEGTLAKPWCKFGRELCGYLHRGCLFARNSAARRQIEKCREIFVKIYSTVLLENSEMRTQNSITFLRRIVFYVGL